MAEPPRPFGILTLDAARCLGWAYAFPCEEPRYSHIDLPRPNGPGYTRLRGFLLDLIEELKPKLIVYEEPVLNHYGPHKTSLQTAMWLMGLAAHIIEIAHLKGIRCEPCNASKLKLFTTGDGRAKKWKMVAAVEQCGWKTETDDEADALAILLWAEVKFAPKHLRSVSGLGPLFGGIENAIVREPGWEAVRDHRPAKSKRRRPRASDGMASLPTVR